MLVFDVFAVLVCALMHGCVKNVHNMVVMCCDCLCA